MGKYSAEPDNATKAAKAKGSNLRCHFKNTRETAQAIKKMPLHRATTYLKNVLAKTEIIPFRRFMGGKYFIFYQLTFKIWRKTNSWQHIVFGNFIHFLFIFIFLKVLADMLKLNTLEPLKDVGQRSLLNFCFICWKMQNLMLNTKAWMLIIWLLTISK